MAVMIVDMTEGTPNFTNSLLIGSVPR